MPYIDKHSESRRQHLPDAAAMLCLQGKLWHAHRELNKAVECYAESLQLNPFMWDAFLGLCEAGKSGPTFYFLGLEHQINRVFRCQYSSSKYLQDEP